MAGPRVLILGGTREAVALAGALVERFGREAVITSLAGRTAAPARVPGTVRTGGFGGAAALAGYLREERIAAVIDATHPFATQISANAAAACSRAGVPRVVLDRPAWQPGPADDWHMVESLAEAAARLPNAGRRVFLSLGPRAVPAFSGVSDVWFLVRMVDPPAEPLPLTAHEVVLGRGPFDEVAERQLMAAHGIDLVITRNSGGEGAVAKLAAARALGLPVIMLARPAPPAGERVATVDAVLAWLAAQGLRKTCV